MSYQWDSGFFKDLASGAYPGSQPQGGMLGAAAQQVQTKPLEVAPLAPQMSGATQAGGLLQTAAPPPVDTGWLKGNAPAPAPQATPMPKNPVTEAPATQAGFGVTNYLYRYSYGTTGNSPYKRDANGNIILNSAGGIADEGTFLGRSMEDGSVNRSPIGNVTADGRVNTYGGYSTSADEYYKPGQTDWSGKPINVGSRPSNGYGYGTLPQAGEQNVLKPLPVGADGEVISTRPTQIGSGNNLGAAFGPGGGVGGIYSGLDKPLPTGPSIGSSNGGNTQGNQSSSRSVDAGTETIEGRIGNILATDKNGNYTNPVIQQAVNTTMQQFAGRGLLNSSMASEAAYQAAVAKAIEIAGPDAQTYFAQGRANQDAANVFERDARGYEQENSRLDKTIAADDRRLDKQLSVDMDKFNKDLQYRYDALNLDKTSQDDARALAQKYAIEMENIKSVNSAYDLYLRRISDIDANTEYNAGTKMRLKNEAGKDFDLYAKAKGISYGMDLANRFTASGQTPAPAPAPGEPGSLVDWGDLNTDRGGA